MWVPLLVLVLVLCRDTCFASLLFAFQSENSVSISSTSSYSSGGVARRDDIDWIRPIGISTPSSVNST